MQMFLENQYIGLALLDQSLTEKLASWINDPEVTQYLLRWRPVTHADEKEWVDGLYKSETSFVFAMVVPNGTPIGTMGLHNISWRDGTATTAAFIGEKTYWGKGMGSHAKMLLLNWAFNTLNLRQIESSVLGTNPRSMRYSLKCGYKLVATIPHKFVRNGKEIDEWVLIAQRDTWEPRWAHYQATGSFLPVEHTAPQL